jgi:hypothetical protein
MGNPERFRNRVFGKERPTDMGDNVIKTWHEMMKEYGWIPLEQFKSTPAICIDALCNEINKDRKEQQKEIDRMKHRRK